MKLSKYVEKIDFDEEQIILFNRINGAIYLADKSEIVDDNVKRESKIHRELENEQFFQEIITEELMGENSDYFLITIELTTMCNMECRYCYEKDKGSRPVISKQIVNDIINYIENVFKNTELSVCVGFIGGEPLLEKTILLEIYKKVDVLGKKYDRRCTFHIDTNGTIEFSDVYRTMNNLHVSVSLSDKGDHNLNRPLKQGDSYESVLKNIKKLEQNEGNSISIRYNTNEKNIYKFDDFLQFIKRELPIVSAVVPMYTDEYDYNKFKNGLGLGEFLTWNSTKAIKDLIKKGFPIDYAIGNRVSKCIAYQLYSCKIYTDGRIGLCDSMFYDDARADIRDVSSRPEELNLLFAEYKTYNALEDEECKNCIKLMQCQGKTFCRENSCNYNKRYDDLEFIKTYVEETLKGNGEYFINM